MISRGRDTNQTVTKVRKKLHFWFILQRQKKVWPALVPHFWQIGFLGRDQIGVTFMVVCPLFMAFQYHTPPFQIRVVEWAWTFHTQRERKLILISSLCGLIESIKSCISALLLADVWPKEELKSSFHRCYEGWFMIRGQLLEYLNSGDFYQLMPIHKRGMDICVHRRYFSYTIIINVAEIG